MAYAVAQDIIDKYGETELIIAADHNGTGVADPEVVTRGIDDAGDEIDTYIGTAYSLPLANVPPILKPLCIDIALYKMSTGTAITDEKRRRYEDAIKILDKIAKGIIKLGLPTGEEPPAKGGGASFVANERQFSREKLEGY